MTEQKMSDINKWLQKVNKDKLEMQEKLVMAGATMEMLEKIEPVYDKYNSEEATEPGMICALTRRIRGKNE